MFENYYKKLVFALLDNILEVMSLLLIFQKVPEEIKISTWNGII